MLLDNIFLDIVIILIFIYVNAFDILYFFLQNKKMEYSLLSDLSLQRQNRRIKVRIERIWDSINPKVDNQLLSVDCILIDEKIMKLPL